MRRSIISAEVAMSFDFSSMPAKYATLTGKNWDYKGNNNFSEAEMAKHSTRVILFTPVGQAQTLHPVRDWCQDQFGDNWIYNWDTFYFKHPEDATLFALRWMNHGQ
jgi:hypothetical protein